MTRSDNNPICPVCGEPLEADWTFCPACETPLGAPLCPQCQQPVKDNWKRCPKCGAQLRCRFCDQRIPAGFAACPICETDLSPKTDGDRTWVDPISGMEFVKVPEGRFEMGDGFDEGGPNEKPLHEVRLNGFYIGKFPVTQAQWNRLMPDNPSQFRGDHLPVEQVSWYATQEFIEKLIRAGGEIQTFRLPTEAEWEYAARSAGRLERYAGGNDPDAVAWSEENSGGTTHSVGQKTPNGLGLFDMSGNVWEWCQDIFLEDAYRRHSVENPVCTAGTGDRVMRGGGWNVDAWSVRCSMRFSLSPDYFGAALGFRLVTFRTQRSSY
jgi:formylglycine-generating enzyme required for sulfatase activity